MNGVSVPIINKLLGHANEQTTLSNYIFDINTADEAYETVINALQNTKAQTLKKFSPHVQGSRT